LKGRKSGVNDHVTLAVTAAPAEVRLDVWLDVSCLFKTRSEAQRACKGGKVDLNGQPGKPHCLLHTGDEIHITRGSGLRQMVIVRKLTGRSVPKAEARTLYEDRTPVPAPEEIALRRAERVFRAAQVAAGPPDKRQRRALRKIRGY
jgi:ribosome-associated heat shock protein Hsp15